MTARASLAALARPATPWPPPTADSAMRDAAVLVLFGAMEAATGRVQTPSTLDVLLLARAATLNSHAGQVAFPGGRRDTDDAGPVETALREAVEETALDTEGVDVLGTLASLTVPVSRHHVTPVLGWWAAPSPIRVVDPAESAHVFRVPVADLIDPANRRTAVIGHNRGARTTPAFLLPAHTPHLVWGFTGLVLSRIFDDLGWSRPWNTHARVNPILRAPGGTLPGEGHS